MLLRVPRGVRGLKVLVNSTFRIVPFHLSLPIRPPPLAFPLPHAAMEGPVPDYYATLGVASTSSSDEIRQAYKRESLRSHPDRFPNASAGERQRHTARFQSLADAYYVLSDTSRRAEYDSLRRSQNFGSDYASSTPPGGFTSDPEKEQESSYRFFQSFFSGATAAAAGAGASQGSSNAGSNGEGSQPQGERVGETDRQHFSSFPFSRMFFLTTQPTLSFPTSLRSCCGQRCNVWRPFGSGWAVQAGLG